MSLREARELMATKQAKNEVVHFSLAIDRQIVEGFLVDQEATLRQLASAGYARKIVLDRAGKLGLTGDFIRKQRTVGFRVSVRSCLSCEETFVSVGPQNRLCNRCRKRQ